jgi:hypothetical protein
VHGSLLSPLKWSHERVVIVAVMTVLMLSSSILNPGSFCVVVVDVLCNAENTGGNDGVHDMVICEQDYLERVTRLRQASEKKERLMNRL